MRRILKDVDIKGIGINYFTMGSVHKGPSSRYDPKSSHFQSWLGGYLVSSIEKKKWTFDEHFALAVVDQTHWLQYYGDENPHVRVTKTEKVNVVTIHSFKCELYEVTFESDSDIGNKNSFKTKVCMSILAGIYNQADTSIRLHHDAFLPKWSANFPLNPYQQIILKAHIAILNIEPTIKAVLYICAADFTDNKNKHYNYFEKVRGNLLEQIKKISIERINDKSR